MMDEDTKGILAVLITVIMGIALIATVFCGAFVLGILSGYDSNVCVSWFILGMIIQIYDEVRKLNEK